MADAAATGASAGGGQEIAAAPGGAPAEGIGTGAAAPDGGVQPLGDGQGVGQGSGTVALSTLVLDAQFALQSARLNALFAQQAIKLVNSIITAMFCDTNRKPGKAQQLLNDQDDKLAEQLAEAEERVASCAERLKELEAQRAKELDALRTAMLEHRKAEHEKRGQLQAESGIAAAAGKRAASVQKEGKAEAAAAAAAAGRGGCRDKPPCIPL